jgi:hypothetical protein
MLCGKHGEKMPDIRGFYRTNPGSDEPYDVYQFEGERVHLSRVTPNVTVSGTSKIDELDSWEPAAFLTSNVNPKAKASFQELWNAAHAKRP